MAGLEPDLELARVGAHRAERHDPRLERTVELGAERRYPAAVGISPRGLGRRIRIGDVFRDHPHAPCLRAQA